MELPIDHFRLLGVSPSAAPDSILRSLQLKLDKYPDKGFTKEALENRAELLRLSSDLLVDKKLREEYETALLAGASGLEISFSREVAGLILLWESEAALEAFRLSCKALQPPQAPALGSGRESDLTLVAALACKAASEQEKELRHYEASANLLEEGLQLLQRMGKLPEYRTDFEREIEELIPYRILDLVSRDLGDKISHDEGIRLLDKLVCDRGGLEGNNSYKKKTLLNQNEFETFFQQIRKFLTVQEQADLFISWQKLGSLDAGFLGAMALIADGFSRRKPERIQEARKCLSSLKGRDIDLMPLFGCIYLLLGNIIKAKEYFNRSEDQDLKIWIEDYPEDILAAICEYCRNWLRKDVLPGYRDVKIDIVDLEAWFSDRDVQTYIESLDKRNAIGIAKAGFSFLSSLSGEESELNSSEHESIDKEEDSALNHDRDSSKEESKSEVGNINPSLLELALYFFESNFVWVKNLQFQYSTRYLQKFRLNKSKRLTFFVLLTIILAGSFSNIYFRNKARVIKPLINKKELVTIEKNPEDETKPLDTKSLDEKLIITPENSFKELSIDKPNLEEIQELIENWLETKASILYGDNNTLLNIVAGEKLVKQVFDERYKDKRLKEHQKIEAKIINLALVSQTEKRIEIKTNIKYNEQRINEKEEIVSETSIPSLPVTYILGREKTVWRIVAYLSGK